MTATPTTKGTGPGVGFPPPLIYVAGFLVGWLLDTRVIHLWPSFLSKFESIVDFIGGLLLGAGLLIATRGVMEFRRAQTAVYPNRDASRLVATGPYARTRNPDYLGLAIAYVGIALFTSSGWALLMLFPVLYAVYEFVIVREERYLTEAFGDEYRQYQERVGRWL